MLSLAFNPSSARWTRGTSEARRGRHNWEVRCLTAFFGRSIDADWKAICLRLDEQLELFDRRPELVPPLIAQRLLVSGEDHRHGIHPGFDPIAICRAFWRRLSRHSREGASTIEQQVVRVLTGRYERTLSRKLREILLAVLVVRRYPKARMPAIYLSVAYYGWRMHGYHQACRRLELSPDGLTVYDAARVVACLKYPQPRVMCGGRERQIGIRAKHLRTLYERHVRGRTYFHLYGPSFQRRTPTLRPVSQS